MVRTYAIFADYHQFYLWDHVADPYPPFNYDDRDMRRRIKAAPHIVVIQPERNMEVPVELEIRDSPPADPFDEWDHVAEASLDLPSGLLEIHECTGGSIDILTLPPGTYRVRACFGGLGTLSEDRMDGDDRYRIVLWPAPAAAVEVLKHYPHDR